MEILFCDVKKYFTDACLEMKHDPDNSNIDYDIKVYNGNILNLFYSGAENTAFISPANSFGGMGAGIDKIYDKFMFPNISEKIISKISQLKTVTYLDRSFDSFHIQENKPYLPIGEAIITPLTDYPKYNSCYLITAPTMVVPDNIVGTNNPYLAFLACLKIVKKYPNIKTLVCPGLGTGVGEIIGYESARQIYEALYSFCLDR